MRAILVVLVVAGAVALLVKSNPELGDQFKSMTADLKEAKVEVSARVGRTGAAMEVLEQYATATYEARPKAARSLAIGPASDIASANWRRMSSPHGRTHIKLAPIERNAKLPPMFDERRTVELDYKEVTPISRDRIKAKGVVHLWRRAPRTREVTEMREDFSAEVVFRNDQWKVYRFDAVPYGTGR